jgi:lipid-A-disaccharide synthase
VSAGRRRTTATLEVALLGDPMVVCYRVSRFTEMISRVLIRIPWISLPNIVAGRAVLTAARAA